MADVSFRVRYGAAVAAAALCFCAGYISTHGIHGASTALAQRRAAALEAAAASAAASRAKTMEQRFQEFDVPEVSSWPEALNAREMEEHSVMTTAQTTPIVPEEHSAIEPMSDFKGGEGGRRLTPSQPSPNTMNTKPASSSSSSFATRGQGSSARKKTGATTSRDEEAGDDEATETTAMEILLTNTYTDKSSVSTLYPWEYLAEPHRTTTLSVISPVDGAAYRWSLADGVLGYGTTVEHVFTETGYQPLLLERMEDDEIVDQVTFNVMVKYVRREIRSMSDADREAWLSAVSIMQRVPTVVGQRLFGSEYFSRDHFTRLHMYYGGAMDCDHWHQGAGFVTSHVALTLQWEKALQAIDPSIAAPYWDFTLESTFFGAADWRESRIFSSDWFGDASPDNDLHTVTEGRWAFVPMQNAKEYSAWHNGFGIMRAPWNLDSTPFVTRSQYIYSLPNNLKPSGCVEYHRTLRKSDWMSLSKVLNSAAHGHIHEIMGGSWNHPYGESIGFSQADPAYTFAHQIQSFSKVLWRKGFVKCSDSCSMTTSTAECACSCDAEAIGDRSSMEVLDEAGLLDSLVFFDKAMNQLDSSNWKDEDGNAQAVLDGYSEEESAEIYDAMLSNLCSPGHLGDMFQASSPNDITFWVIHSTIDRAWHLLRLNPTSNFDETWDPYHPCYGHNPMNFQPFRNLFKDDHNKFYTNKELYDLLAPTAEHLPYVYDNFEWPHCSFLGYDMTV